MVLRIDEVPNNSQTILRLIGRISSPDVKELKAKTAPVETPDRDAVHFLAIAEKKGIALRRPARPSMDPPRKKRKEVN